MYTAIILAVGLVLLVLASAFAFGAPVLAIPVLLVILVGGAMLSTARRRRSMRSVRDFREQPEQDVEFTDRDQQTLSS